MKGKIPRKTAVIDGYLMRKIRTNADGTVIFACFQERHMNSTCRGEIKIIDPNIKRYRRFHNHPPDSEKDKAYLLRSNLRKLAREHPSIKPHDIIIDQRHQNSGTVNRLAGSYCAQRQSIYGVRKKLTDDYKTADIPPHIIAGKAALTQDGKKFLICDEIKNGKRMIIFGSELDVELLCLSEIVTIDGTFDVVPAPFYQLVTFVAEISEGVHRPCLFALIESKEQLEYERIMQVASSFFQGRYPATIITDLERGLSNAVLKYFPQSRYQFCYFHLIHAWLQKLNSFPTLKKEIEPGMMLSTFWMRLKTLPFFHPSMVSTAYAFIIADIAHIQLAELNQFRNYIEEFYLYGRRGLPPRFPPDVWNCVAAVRNDEPRTSNHIEAWHRILNGLLYVVGYKNVAKLSALIKRLAFESFDTMKINEIVTSSTAPVKVKEQKKSRNLLKNARLKQIVLNRPSPLPLPSLPEMDLIADILRMC